MMISVRKDVLAATGGYQVPWESSSLTRQFAFAPGPASPASPEMQLWQLAVGARDPALLNIYLDRYPEGEHRPDARQLLAALPSTSVPRGTVATDAAQEDTLWNIAKRARMRPLVEFYVARNPDGRYIGEAQDLLKVLPRIGGSDEPPESVCERLATHPRDATANTSGTLLSELAQNADLAISACEKARAAHPEAPHYTALLARAMTAAGRRDEAIRLYREAADRGNLRALVSLGLITEAGDGVRRDPKAAMALYERAAKGGSPDGAINLAVGLQQGVGVARNPRRAVELLTKAARDGSAIATYNLGVLAQQKVTPDPSLALGYFQKATELGDARGYLAGAILLDKALGVKKDPSAAATMLLQGVAADSGESLNAIATNKLEWSPETLSAMQARLKKGGYYKGPVNGRPGSDLKAALVEWRNTGSLDLDQGG
jgi:TPR repeat protein